MATKSVTTSGDSIPMGERKTVTTSFYSAAAYPDGLFRVTGGVEATYAFSVASCIADYVKARLVDAVANEGMDANEAYALKVLVDMVDALYRAGGAEA